MADASDKQAGAFEDVVQGFGRTVGGIASRLFGTNVVARPKSSGEPVLSPETDAVIDAAGDAMGRWLNATGEALKEHPMDPLAAARSVQSRASAPVVADEGWTPLSVGLRSLGGGALKVAEGVLDKVAPKRRGDEGGGDAAG